MSRRPPWVQLAVLAWCAVQARAMATAWRDSPYDHVAFLALAVWLVPVWLRPWSRDARPAAVWPSFVALGAGFVAAAGQVHTLAYAALALAAAALLPPDLRWAAWLATAPAWWVGQSWAVKALPVAALPPLRVAVATVGVLAAVARRRVATPTRSAA